MGEFVSDIHYEAYSAECDPTYCISLENTQYSSSNPSPVSYLLSTPSANYSSEPNHLNSIPWPLSVVFICKQKSHFFEERRVNLGGSSIEEPIKIGRLVAKLRPGLDNAIFDCKVLSRNHAVIWSDHQNRVWLKDTHSSNGTFVNSVRLSKVSEESEPREIFSGDIIQFGVEVMENNIMRGCIITQISIVDSNGLEISPPHKIQEHTDQEAILNSPFSNEQIFQLSQYLQEALYREDILENKMRQLHSILTEIDGSCIDNWQIFLNEERLLSKVKFLESQLEIYSLQFSDDHLRSIAATANQNIEDMQQYANEEISRLNKDNFKIVNNMIELELNLKNREQECENLRSKCELIEANLNAITEAQRLTSEKLCNQMIQTSLESINSISNKEMEILSDEVGKLKLQICELNSQLELVERERDDIRLKLQKLPEEYEQEMAIPKISNPNLFSVHNDFPLVSESEKSNEPVMMTDSQQSSENSTECDSFSQNANVSICEQNSITRSLRPFPDIVLNSVLGSHDDPFLIINSDNGSSNFNGFSKSHLNLSENYIETLVERIVTKLVSFQASNQNKEEFNSNSLDEASSSLNANSNSKMGDKLIDEKFIDHLIENQIRKYPNNFPTLNNADNFNYSSLFNKNKGDSQFSEVRQNLPHSRIISAVVAVPMIFLILAIMISLYFRLISSSTNSD